MRWTCTAAAISALIVICCSTPALANPIYSPGFVWDRQADWTPGTPGIPPVGNPDDDALGSPVWSYEYQANVPRAADLDTTDGVTPWYQRPTTGLLNWFQEAPPTQPAWGTGPMVRQDYMWTVSGGGSGTTVTYTPVVRWQNPLLVPAVVRLDGSFAAKVTDGNPQHAGEGDIDFAIARVPAGGGTPEPIYTWYQRNVQKGNNEFSVSLPSPLTVSVDPGDSIIWTVISKPAYGDISTMASVTDDFTITLQSPGHKPINYITGETLDGGFSAGQLAISDTCSVYIDAPIEETHEGATMSLTATLARDDSAGGLAKGIFDAGTLTITDAGGQDILVAALDSLVLSELSPGANILAGEGLLTATGGYYADSFADGVQLVQISFSIPGGLDDFAADFTAVSNLTVSPIPEPASLLLLASGVVALGRRRR